VVPRFMNGISFSRFKIKGWGAWGEKVVVNFNFSCNSESSGSEGYLCNYLDITNI
jgi:hypothetical protein